MFATICDCLRRLATVCDNLRPFVTICDRLRPFVTVCKYLRPFAKVCHCLRPFATVCDHLRSFVMTCDHLRPFKTICDRLRRFSQFSLYRCTKVVQNCNHLFILPLHSVCHSPLCNYNFYFNSEVFMGLLLFISNNAGPLSGTPARHSNIIG